MTTTYIKWPIEIDAAFCASYAELTGETIADDQPRDETHIETGSSRLTPEQINAIKARWPQVSFFLNPTIV